MEFQSNPKAGGKRFMGVIHWEREPKGIVVKEKLKKA